MTPPSEQSLPRGPHGLDPEDVAASQRGRLLDAVTALVASEGYTGTSVRAVAARAGVSLSTFYALFADKEDCFLQAYDRVADQLIGAVVDAAGAAEDQLGMLRQGLAAYLAWFAAHPAAAATYLLAVRTAGPAALERRALIIGRFEAAISAFEPAAAPEGVAAFAAVVDSAANEVVRRGTPEALPELAPRLEWAGALLLTAPAPD